MWDGTIANPIAYDEYSAAVTTDKNVWTGTLVTGVVDPSTGGVWNNPFTQAKVGVLDLVDTRWIAIATISCTDVARLYGISPAITVLPELGGDFDGDGDVDGRDFLIWQRGESPNPFSAEDLEVWQTAYNTSSPIAGASRVPEPAPVLIIYALGCAVLGWRYPMRFSCRSARFAERK